MGLSPLAHQIPKLKDGPDRTAPVFGVAVHTTGSTAVETAQKKGADPLEYLVAYYAKPDSYSAHYVIGYNGMIIQIADEQEKAQHIGFSPEDRSAFLTGAWEKKLPKEFVELWKKAWPGCKSPAHLFPGPSPNNVYVGVELLPIVKNNAKPMRPGLLYTEEQHSAVASLIVDVSKRWAGSWAENWWYGKGHLVGHEDVNPLQRTTKKPPAGWDPGALRTQPWIDFTAIRDIVAARVFRA